MELVRLIFSFRGEASGSVELEVFNNFEDLFGIDIAADTAFTVLRIDVTVEFFKIGYCIQRISCIDRIAALVENPEFVEKLVDE